MVIWGVNLWDGRSSCLSFSLPFKRNTYLKHLEISSYFCSYENGDPQWPHSCFSNPVMQSVNELGRGGRLAPARVWVTTAAHRPVTSLSQSSPQKELACPQEIPSIESPKLLKPVGEIGPEKSPNISSRSGKRLQKNHSSSSHICGSYRYWSFSIVNFPAPTTAFLQETSISLQVQMGPPPGDEGKPSRSCRSNPCPVVSTAPTMEGKHTDTFIKVQCSQWREIQCLFV